MYLQNQDFSGRKGVCKKKDFLKPAHVIFLSMKLHQTNWRKSYFHDWELHFQIKGRRNFFSLYRKAALSIS
jgi:hypothetical protein